MGLMDVDARDQRKTSVSVVLEMFVKFYIKSNEIIEKGFVNMLYMVKELFDFKADADWSTLKKNNVNNEKTV